MNKRNRKKTPAEKAEKKAPSAEVYDDLCQRKAEAGQTRTDSGRDSGGRVHPDECRSYLAYAKRNVRRTARMGV